MIQGFFLRICRVDVVPQNCGVAARSPPLPEATTIKRASGKFPTGAVSPGSFPAFLVRNHSQLFVVGWLETGWLFEDIEERSRAIDSVALRIAYLFHDTCTF